MVEVLHRDDEDGSASGASRPLPIQVDWLPQNVAPKLPGEQVTVEKPDGSKSRWQVDMCERHCGMRLIYLAGATSTDVFPGCFVYW